MASTGSNREAKMAGKIPAISPMMVAKLVPRMMFPKPRTNSKSKTLVKTNAIIQTKSSPTIPRQQRK